MQMMTLLQETAKSRGKDNWKNDFFLLASILHDNE